MLSSINGDAYTAHHAVALFEKWGNIFRRLYTQYTRLIKGLPFDDTYLKDFGAGSEQGWEFAFFKVVEFLQHHRLDLNMDWSMHISYIASLKTAQGKCKK